MTRERPIAVELEIDEAQPLRGRLRTRGGPWCAFAGWIGLAGAIDGAIGTAVPASAAGVPSPGDRDAAATGPLAGGSAAPADEPPAVG